MYNSNFSSDTPSKADLLNNIGNIFLNQGKLDEALDKYQAAFLIYKNFFGEERKHLSIADVLNNIANVYYRKLQYDDALKKYQESLLLYTELLPASNGGCMHPSHADLLNNIGNILFDQGKFDKHFFEFLD